MGGDAGFRNQLQITGQSNGFGGRRLSFETQTLGNLTVMGDPAAQFGSIGLR